MRLLIFTLVALIASFHSVSQDLKKNKNKNQSFITKEVIFNDTLIIERVPLNEMKSDQRYYIDALQNQLDKSRIEVKEDSVVDQILLVNIEKLITVIKGADKNWKSQNYSDELNYYSKYKAEFENEIDSKINTSSSPSSSYSPSHAKVIQTGPRGGKYYINSNGNKTYLKKKN